MSPITELYLHASQNDAKINIEIHSLPKIISCRVGR